MRYLIVGGGVAGITAAQAIRTADADAEVHVFSDEPYPYYRRPLLWELIAGQIEPDAVFYRPAEWYAKNSIMLHLNTKITELDPADRWLRCANGSEYAYDRLLLATGARAFLPACAGNTQPGVFTLRTLDDALAIKAYMQRISTAAVIGGGLLGLETARALHLAGLDVTVFEFFPHLLPRQLDAEGARVLQSLLEAQGLHIVTGAEAEAILGTVCASSLRLRDGRIFPGELILFSTGIRSETHLARYAGLNVNRGVIVNRLLETSAPHVFAAGDCAEFDGRVYGIIPPAIEQARVAAANMIEYGSASYSGTLPITTLKVAGAELSSLGECLADGEGYTVRRYADLDAGIYRKVVLREGRIVGAILLNDRRRLRPITQLIERRTDVSAFVEQLLDDDFEFETLINQTLEEVR